MSKRKIWNDARMRIASASDKNAMDVNVLGKGSPVMTRESEVSGIGPFMQSQTSVAGSMSGGLEDIIFVDESGRKVRMVK